MKKLEFKLDKQKIKNIFKTKWKLLLLEVLLFAGALALDLGLKPFLADFLATQPNKTFTLIPNFIDLTYVENTGAGFGTLKGNTILLSVITGIVVLFIFFYLTVSHKEGEKIRIPLVFIAAGGLGNLVDRIMLGYVRDFFEFTFMEFAIFNIADIFVTVGAFALVISLIILMVQESRKSKKKLEESNVALIDKISDGSAFQSNADTVGANKFSVEETHDSACLNENADNNDNGAQQTEEVAPDNNDNADGAFFTSAIAKETDVEDLKAKLDDNINTDRTSKTNDCAKADNTII